MAAAAQQPLTIFSTCPPSNGAEPRAYLQRVIDVSRWSDQAGYAGILVYSDNSLVDPWSLAQIIIQQTKRLAPLVAVQPVYLHPYAVAKQISTLAWLYDRRLYLNMVAGGFKNDLTALNDPAPHDQRYARLIEYTTIITRLLSGQAPVSFAGKFYTVDKLKLTPPLPRELFPGILISGSSPAGVAAAGAIDATAVQYPRPADEYAAAGTPRPPRAGIRIGLISRNTDDEAWAVAHRRFPEDRKGQITHQVAMKVSDSLWHQQLSQLAESSPTGRHPYWLTPFLNYQTFCPYLVGSHARVAGELARYMALGFITFIVDVPADEDEAHRMTSVFQQASELVTQ